MSDALKNFSYSTVATAPSPPSSGLSLVVEAGEGALFPTVPFDAVVWPAGEQPSAANAEIVRVTERATDTFTLLRTRQGTAARTILVGDQFAANITVKTLEEAGGDRIPAEDMVVRSGHSHIVADEFEILSGVEVEIQDDGILEII